MDEPERGFRGLGIGADRVWGDKGGVLKLKN